MAFRFSVHTVLKTSIGVVLLLTLLLYFHEHSGQVVEETLFSGKTQGTTYSIKITSLPLGSEQKKAIESIIQQRLDKIDRAMSLYRDDSELVRFNQQQTTTPVPVSPELIEVFQAARMISEASDGAFDVTAAPLISAWGFGPSKRKDAQPPSAEEIAELLQRVGYEKIEIDASAGTLRKMHPDMTCDVNGIAQGYTVDKLADGLHSLGYTDYLVEVGGEVKARGRNARGTCWNAAIEKPSDKGQELQQILPLDNMSLTTAGDYRNYTEKDGVRLCHIIDPHTGRPIAHNLASVSVLHPKCTLADGYDTALMVLGPEKGYELAVKRRVAVQFICHDTEQDYAVRTTPEFDAIVQGRTP